MVQNPAAKYCKLTINWVRYLRFSMALFSCSLIRAGVRFSFARNTEACSSPFVSTQAQLFYSRFPSMYCKKLFWLILLTVAGVALPCGALLGAEPPRPSGVREHLVFLQGTPQELEVFRIHGRYAGPTVMLLGGIHGDERGAYLSADHYAGVAVKKGTLIVVPRANSNSVIHNLRGRSGDMNRKFGSSDHQDPESAVVEILKSLIAESDFLVTMHEGSGFYRPKQESDLVGPHRYGQSIIADADCFRHAPSGREIDLRSMAESVLHKVNGEIALPLYRMHFLNMRTAEEDSPYKEHRLSATYYALTRFGIPAFCVEASKNLPSLDMKVRLHNETVSAFLDLAGVELELPGVPDHAPSLGYLVISVNGENPLAVANGNTLMVAPGDRIEILHISANRSSGLSTEVQGLNEPSFFGKPVVVSKPTSILVRKDNVPIGKIAIGMLPQQRAAASPRVVGQNTIAISYTARAAESTSLPGSSLLASAEEALKPPLPAAAQVAASPEAVSPASSDPASPPSSQAVPEAGTNATSSDHGAITGFLVEIDGTPIAIAPDREWPVRYGAHVKIVDIQTSGPPAPSDLAMNLKGFIAQKEHNTGEDRGGVADTTALMPAFSEGRKGEVYAINAERGSTVLASCYLRILKPQLESVTVRIAGEVKVLTAWSRTSIPAGTPIELVHVALKGGLEMSRPRYTLAGKPLPASLPQTLSMRDIAINLAIFENEILLGKVTLLP